MRFSLEWLREHVEIEVPPAELARRLTSVGLAVEGTESYGEDTVFEVEVTGNRPDCMNHRGLAREIGAFTGRSLRPQAVSLPASARPTSSVARVEIADAQLCSRYTARLVLGVRIGPSPAWLERRLRAIGLAPKWNVVDAANFVLWDLGHPLHTFDLDRLEGGAIVVRRASPGEHLVTVADGVDHMLQESMLVIADASRPVAIAGVMGGLESGISEGSRDVLIESAWFDPLSIRRTARSLGMHTDASHRFERGADPEITLLAADRLARLVLDLAGGECLEGAIDIVARPHRARRPALRRGRLVAVLGAPVADEEVEIHLRRLEISLERTGEGWTATIPSHRPDLEIEEDLIEEVARSVGYDRFPSSLPSATTLPPERLPRDEPETRLRETLAWFGFSETIGYAMVVRDWDALLAPTGSPPPLAIENPLSDRWEVMRRTILPGLVLVADHNLRHGQRNLAIFEVGAIFHRSVPAGGASGWSSPSGATGTGDVAGEDPAAPLDSRPFREERVVGLFGCGRAGGARWNLPGREFDVFDATGAIEGIAKVFRAGPLTFRPLSSGHAAEAAAVRFPFLHPQKSFRALIAGEPFGFGGVIHPDVAVQLELPAGCVLAQVSLAPLSTRRGPEVPFHPLPRFPAVSRDISAIVSARTLYAEVEQVVKEALSGAPAGVVLADRYEGPPLPRGEVSLTFRITIEPQERTWTVEEIDGLTGRVMRALEERVGARIRAG